MSKPTPLPIPPAWPLWLPSAAVAAVLLATASRYGYHRDELYFIACGKHLAWGYPDQGPLTPLIARLMTALAPGSLWVLRLPSALAAAVTVRLAGRTAQELGGLRRAQLLAEVMTAVASVVLVTGHLLSTSTFDLLVWTCTLWLTVRAVRRHLPRTWPWVGVVIGIGMLNKPLPAFLAVALLLAILLSGPRHLLRTAWFWAGAVLAAALSAPFVIWQAAHGWPQVTVARGIAQGGSASSQPGWAVLPFQLLLVSPLLAPVWIAGLVALFRRPEWRCVRFVGWAWLLLAVAFTAVGGKPYYLAGMLPTLVAAGAVRCESWLAGAARYRAVLVRAAIAVSAVVCAVISLPLLPAARSAAVVAVNPDVGETIGWPQFVATVAGVSRELAAPNTVVFTRNYGEAGALERYGHRFGLQASIFSGHNGFGSWGPPPAAAAPVIVVGYSSDAAGRWFSGCTLRTRFHDSAGIDNEENGVSILVCTAPRTSWADEWDQLRHLN
ncbi:MAG TPA: glycosyltransferase family 39 protein [Jatrophihabitans sp.]|nr:glycosyltransferase family 39 protein [Jatrophihabitans sp.]